MKARTETEYREVLYSRMRAKTVVKEETGCWEWQGFVDRKRKYAAHRYGQTNVRGKTTSAHRAMYYAANGEIAKGFEVCHSCDNPICVNPAHLWLGTHKDNMADSKAKGRHYVSTKELCKRGHPLSGDNLYYHEPTKSRHCKECQKLNLRRRYHANREQFRQKTRAYRARQKAKIAANSTS